LNIQFSKSSWVVLLFLFIGFLSACQKIHDESQRQPTEKISSSADAVKVRAVSIAIPAGGNADAIVILSILPGLHINANPATFPYLIATEVKASQGDGITTGMPGYPVAERKKFQFADQPLDVYEGEAPIRLPLRVETNATKGSRSLPISVRVQACDNEKCYAPATLNATIAVDVK